MVLKGQIKEIFINEKNTPLPANVAKGLWRIDKAHDWLTEFHLQKALWKFTTEEGPSKGRMRELVIGEEMDIQKRNQRNFLGTVENLDSIIKRLGLFLPINESQAGGLLHAVQRRLSVVQGPPGTGKTTFAAALFLLLRILAHKQKWKEKILLTASGNVAVDNLVKRIRDIIQDTKIWKKFKSWK